MPTAMTTPPHFPPPSARYRAAPAYRYGPVRGLAVVVPALNEQTNIAACLDSLAAAASRLAIPTATVVADAGSTDVTRDLAAAHGALVVTAPKGRGCQIRAGIDTLPSPDLDCLLVLHADCRLEPDALSRLVAALDSRPEAHGGALGMRPASGFRHSSLAAWLSSLRTRLTGISFGDQGQFVRRQALERIGGFPDMALMEDVELSLRLRDLGPTIHLGHGVIASARAWRKYGFHGYYRRVLPLLLTYLIRRRLGLPNDPEEYYRKYYG